ncbi:MAG: penicillin acylase family protein [Alphaproteobacteria bacterium]|nr:penicillin acylase family protein [Alphaproteobacteria bacterium]
MRRLKARLFRSLIFLAALLAVGGAGGYLWLLTSLPQIEGEIAVAGIGSTVAISRSPEGVPTIRAESEQDAYFGLGFVHAQDRLWQMEAMRRVAAGRMAELVGAKALPLDRFMRTLGLYRLAEDDAEQMPASVRGALEAYAAGVNAFLAHHPRALPIEFAALLHRPEPWRTADSLVWGRLMALRLGAGWRGDLLRGRVAARLGHSALDTLWPPYPPGAPSTVTAQGALLEMAGLEMAGAIDRLLASLPDDIVGQGASNAWVIAGERTRSGKPLLANDPHLALGVPNVWYLARIELPDWQLAGATHPGVPFIILGHNGRIAWGFTTTGGDTSDIFIDRLVPGDPSRYVMPEGPRALTVREESIRVRWGKDAIHTVRATHHGPVVSDVAREVCDLTPEGHVLALADTALLPGDLTAVAVHGLNWASNAEDVATALQSFHAPQQNVFYGDRAGNIGFHAPARVPIRQAGDGRLPLPGWTGEFEWIGYLPFSSLPHSLNPSSGYIANANERPVPAGHPHFLGADWEPPFRAQRLRELIDMAGPHDIDRSATIQLDILSPEVADLLPLLLSASPASERAASAMSLLSRWDGRMDRSRPQPLIYYAWLREAIREVFEPRLGPVFAIWWSERPLAFIRALANPGAWCQAEGPGCSAKLAAALERALDQLTGRHGSDMARWRWGDAHRARFKHALFDGVPIIGNLLELSIESDGGSYTLNRGMPQIAAQKDPFANVHGAGYRAIYDLGDLDRSRFAIAAGQSGNPLSRHYGDLLKGWRDGEYLRLVSAPEGGPTLRLVPALGGPSSRAGRGP